MNESNTRDELFNALRSLGAVAPGMRVGQLVAALGELCDDLHGRGLWDAEDDELLEAVWRFQRDLENSHVASLSSPSDQSLQQTSGGKTA